MQLGGDGSRVDRLEIVCPGGNTFAATATIVVLATGGVENSRVLLSSPGRSGRGIGNEHDNVGRYFMEHLAMDCGTLEPIDRPLDVDDFLETTDGAHGKYQPMLWLGEETIRSEGLLNAAFWIYDTTRAYLSPGISAARSFRAALRSRPVQHSGTHLARIVRGAPDIARFAWTKVARRGRAGVTSVRILAEQRPDRESRIQLSPQVDALGLRRISIDWRIGEADLRSIARHRDILGQRLRDAGVAQLVDPVDPFARRSPLLPNYHHIGGTRMHTDPAQGVVDEHCRVHSTTNLYVAGGSVFPAGGYLNPTLTIIAMALRLADTIEGRLKPTVVTAPT
jgi:choline dehydrogenase-like flavoprotein